MGEVESEKRKENRYLHMEQDGTAQVGHVFFKKSLRDFPGNPRVQGCKKDKIITGYETWVYGYDPETKHQSAEWRCQGELRPKKSRLLKSRNKVLLVAFLDKKGIFHHEYLPAGQTVIKDMYLGILRRLREAIRKKRPEKWTNGGWILHHDNARPHTAHLMTSFLAKNGTQILLQPPYFPDIAPNDFFLFPKLKAVLKGRHFDTRDDIIEKSPLALKSIPKEGYKNCFDNWEKRCRCILANSGYDPTNIYNADETGLFFQLIPDRTLAHKDENCRGVKRMKQRITVLLCCNSTGTDKRRLLIIGKSAKPRCFRNFSPHFYCTYTSNSKAWMTSSIFREWLLQFNKQLVSEGRRILLLLDNATSLCVPNDGLSNIKIHFLPPNMTASLQPLDSGIIKSFKAQYRKLQLQKMVELADAHLPTELRLDYAVRYCKMAWDSVSPDSIRNCWNHTGIIRFTSTAAVEPLNYGNLLDRIRDIFAIIPEKLKTEREFQLVDDSQEAEMKLTDDNFLVSTVTVK
ncbi:TIGD6 [Cordylochernes scorpioides]|uniref:TIGD6 n=1 Tax=Cordylochernes scorpioides TaxID=51811 RepID=A0ABY6K2L5_9ARAC|nr:TIGD6 [Cordylochernes scorpioides]